MKQLCKVLANGLWLRFVLHPIYARAFESGGITYDEYRESLGFSPLSRKGGQWTKTDKQA